MSNNKEEKYTVEHIPLINKFNDLLEMFTEKKITPNIELRTEDYPLNKKTLILSSEILGHEVSKNAEIYDEACKYCLQLSIEYPKGGSDE